MLLGAIFIAAASMAMLLPSSLGSFGLATVTLPSYPVVTTMLLVLLLAVHVPVHTWFSGYLPARQGDVIPRQFAVLLLFLCLSFALAGNTHAYAFTLHHNLTADAQQHCCWVDSACTKSIFRDQSLLINVHKLSAPEHVRGIGNSRISTYYQGDYPLVLRSASG